MDRAAIRQVHQHLGGRVICKVLRYVPTTRGGPSVVCVPYGRIKDSRGDFRTEEAFNAHYARQIWVAFPYAIKFDVHKDRFDVYVTSPFHTAREAFPVLKPNIREQQFTVPEGFTPEEVNDPGIDPKNIVGRIFSAKGKIRSYRGCREDEPRYPRGQDEWFGPIRRDMDRLYTDIWAGPGRMLVRFDRAVTTFMTNTPRFPLAGGVDVQWKDRREHPFQDHVGSSAVTNYQRLIYNIVDPGYIVGVYKALKDYFENLDREVSGGTTFVTSHEVFDFNRPLPEDE